jgi:hypothetical protein
MAIAPDSAYADMLAQKKAAPKSKLQPTVTIGGAPAGYAPVTTMQPTVTIGGAPAGYTATTTPNYITGAGVPGVTTTSTSTPVVPNYITGANVPDPNAGWTSKGNQAFFNGVPFTGVRNGIQFINGYRQDMYNPDGTDRVADKKNGAVTKEVTAFDAASDAILAQTLTSYGLDGVAATIAKIRGEYPEISSEQLLMLLKNDSRFNTEYLKRFAGNAKLKAAGLPTLDDASYLKAEDEYKKIFTAYGATSLANRDYYATLIGNRMDAVDVTDRMNLAYARLQATPEVKKAFQTFYSAVSDGDILAAILDPTTQLPILQKKVAAAEIGGAALKQNLQTSLATATELAGLGVTQAQAQAGYATIAQSLPSYEKILEMRTGGNVEKSDAQALLEESTLKKNAKAIEAQRVAVEEELNRFAARAGNLGSKSFASQQRGAGLL